MPSFSYIDNSGAGNCGYYAYAKALIYYLREHPDQQPVLTDLGLSPAEQQTLIECDDRIESLLGMRLRNLAVAHTRVEYKYKDEAEEGYRSCNFFQCVEYAVRELIAAEYPELKTFLGFKQERKSRVDTQNYTEADILKKTPGLKASLKQAFMDEKESFHVGQAKEMDRITRESEIDTWVRGFSKHFLDSGWLDEYLAWAVKEGSWASEEILFCLHRAVTGERKVRHGPDNVEFQIKYQIPFSIVKNGRIVGFHASEGIFLVNQSNVHWVTAIPAKSTPSFIGGFFSSLFGGSSDSKPIVEVKQSHRELKRRTPSVHPVEKLPEDPDEYAKQFAQDQFATWAKCYNVARLLAFLLDNLKRIKPVPGFNRVTVFASAVTYLSTHLDKLSKVLNMIEQQDVSVKAEIDGLSELAAALNRLKHDPQLVAKIAPQQVKDYEADVTKKLSELNAKYATLNLVQTRQPSAVLVGGEDLAKSLDSMRSDGLTNQTAWLVMALHVKTLYKDAKGKVEGSSYNAAGGRKAKVLFDYMQLIYNQYKINERLTIKAGQHLKYQARNGTLQAVTTHRSYIFRCCTCKSLTRLKDFNEMVQDLNKHAAPKA